MVVLERGVCGQVGGRPPLAAAPNISSSQWFLSFRFRNYLFNFFSLLSTSRCFQIEAGFSPPKTILPLCRGIFDHWILNIKKITKFNGRKNLQHRGTGVFEIEEIGPLPNPILNHWNPVIGIDQRVPTGTWGPLWILQRWFKSFNNLK